MNPEFIYSNKLVVYLWYRHGCIDISLFQLKYLYTEGRCNAADQFGRLGSK